MNQLSKHETQLLIEQQYNKNQKQPYLEHIIRNAEPVMAIINTVEDLNTRNNLVRIMAQMAYLKSCLITTILGMNCSKPEHMQIAYDNLIWLASNDLIDINKQQISETEAKVTVEAKLVIDEATRNHIRKYMYLPPMIVRPNIVTSNRGSGYLTISNDSLILKKNHHEMDICLDHINRMNGIAFSLDERIIRKIRDTRNHLNAPKAGETTEEYQDRVNDFLRMERESMHVFALMINSGNKFYLTHKPDKRGRTYAQGHHINYQGNCYRKAIMRLAEPEYVEL